MVVVMTDDQDFRSMGAMPLELDGRSLLAPARRPKRLNDRAVQRNLLAGCRGSGRGAAIEFVGGLVLDYVGWTMTIGSSEA